jgi:hypothetical protein
METEVELSALGVGATVFARLVESFTLPSYEQRRFDLYYFLEVILNFQRTAWGI